MEKGSEVICIEDFNGLSIDGRIISSLQLPKKDHKYIVDGSVNLGALEFLDLLGFPHTSHFYSEGFKLIDQQNNMEKEIKVIEEVLTTALKAGIFQSLPDAYRVNHCWELIKAKLAGETPEKKPNTKT